MRRNVWVQVERNMFPFIALAGLAEMFNDAQLVAGYASLAPLAAGIVAVAVWPRSATLLVAGCIALVSAFMSQPWMAVVKVKSPDMDVLFYAEKFARLGSVWIAVFLASIAIMASLFGIRRLYTR
jgi:cytochrome b